MGKVNEREEKIRKFALFLEKGSLTMLDNILSSYKDYTDIYSFSFLLQVDTYALKQEKNFFFFLEQFNFFSNLIYRYCD